MITHYYGVAQQLCYINQEEELNPTKWVSSTTFAGENGVIINYR